MEDVGFFETAIESFPWESDVQKEGYLAFVQYLSKFGKQPTLPIDPVVTFFIQKDHESNEYWRGLVGTQVGDLQNQIKLLQMKTEYLEERLKIQTQTVDLIVQQLKKT